jgi:hypothetical protein
MPDFVIISILVTCDCIVSVTKVVVHGMGEALFPQRPFPERSSDHRQQKKTTAPPCIRDMIYSLPKVYTNSIDMLKNIFLS